MGKNSLRNMVNIQFRSASISFCSSFNFISYLIQSISPVHFMENLNNLLHFVYLQSIKRLSILKPTKRIRRQPTNIQVTTETHWHYWAIESRLYLWSLLILLIWMGCWAISVHNILWKYTFWKWHEQYILRHFTSYLNYSWLTSYAGAI